MNPYYPNLLFPLQVGNTILKNRMICPPSEPHPAQAGENWPSDSLIAHYAQRAKGGAAIVTCDGNSFGTRPGGNGWDASSPDAQNYMSQMADAVHFYGARAHVSNPNYGQLLYQGKPEEIVPCLRCNKCHTGNHHLTVCVVNPRFGSEKWMDRLIVPATEQKRVAIIGGGPAGMKAAITAADRGHTVDLYEKNDHLGGMIDHSRYASFKWPMLNLLKYFERKVNGHPNITVHLDCAPDPQWLEQQGYDVVMAAVGSVPVVPPIPGIENAIPATRAFGHEEFVDNNVVIIGGGEIGVETGLHLAQKGKQVTVIEMKDVVAEEAKRVHYYNMFIDAVEEYQDSLNIILKATCTEVTAQGVTYRDEAGALHTVEAGTVLLAAGMKANAACAYQYAGCGKQFFAIGDCAQQGNLQTAIRTGFQIASTI